MQCPNYSKLSLYFTSSSTKINLIFLFISKESKNKSCDYIQVGKQSCIMLRNCYEENRKVEKKKPNEIKYLLLA